MTAGLVFYALAALTILSAFFVVFSRNIVHAGFSLLFTLFGVAGLYASLGSDFLAVTQVIVYIGGILVLVLFTVMMTRIPRTPGGRELDRQIPAGVFALLLFALLYRVITGTHWGVTALPPPEAKTALLGSQFLTAYLFPFEFVSLVLLVAMIGAAILIRDWRTDRPAGGPAAGDHRAGAAGGQPEAGQDAEEARP